MEDAAEGAGIKVGFWVAWDGVVATDEVGFLGGVAEVAGLVSATEGAGMEMSAAEGADMEDAAEGAGMEMSAAEGAGTEDDGVPRIVRACW